MGCPCGAQMGPWWVPYGSHVYRPNGPLVAPPGQFCVGPTWAAHNCPYGPPSWGPPVAHMGCPCGAQMGPWWVPYGSHVYRPNGPRVPPLANSAWAPHGPPITGPTGHPHGTHLWPALAVHVGPRWIHGGARMGPTCIAQMGPLWPPGQFCVGPVWAAHMGPSGPPTWGQHGDQTVLLAG